MTCVIRGVAVVSLAFALGCQDSSQPGSSGRVATIPEPSATLARESYSGFTESTNDVINSYAEWQQAWARLYATVMPKPILPTVDFFSDRVLLVASGQRNSGGFSIHVDSLIASDDGTTVFSTFSVPGNCVVTGALTQPVHAVRVQAPKLPVSFVRQTVVQSCA